jgi:MoaA/NifB/PqqE/SkfB family radical SAM enzyme
LLLPELPDYIAFAKKNGLMTRLDTNGLLLHEEMVVMLRNSGLDHIGVSIDSLNEEIHDKNRGIPGTLKTALQGISYCQSHNLDCSISTVASKQSLENGDLYNIIQMAAGLKIKVRILSPVSCGRWKNRSDVALSQAEVRYVRGFLRRGKVFWDSELIDGPETPFSCGAKARRLVYISPHGNVQLCSYIPIVFGNINEAPLIKILKKMRCSDILSDGSDSLDCPTNSINFQNRYGCYMDTGVVIPSTLKRALYNESIYTKNRRGRKKTVESVNNSALARKQGAEVFDSAQALVPGGKKVAGNTRA